MKKLPPYVLLAFGLVLVGCDEEVPSSDAPSSDAISDTASDTPVRDFGTDLADASPSDVAPDADAETDAPDVDEDLQPDATDVSEDAGGPDAGPVEDTGEDSAPDAERDADVACEEVCNPEVLTRCGGEVVETCRGDEDGCASWSRTEDCAAAGVPCIEDETGGFCLEPGCTDGFANGDETDVDCGGPTCEPCADGLICVEDSDCLSVVCVDAICAAPECGDGVVNAVEEQCDDGNDDDEDSCANDCTLNGCDGCGLSYTTPTDSALTGNASGGSRFDDPCPEGQLLIGVNSQVSGWIRQLGVQCGIPSVVVDGDGARIAIEPGFAGPMHGLGSGSAASALCPVDHAMRGFGSRAGLLIDQLTPVCISWTVEASAEGFALVESAPVSGTSVGGSGGDPRPDVNCPAGQVGIGGIIRAGDSVDAFGMMCAAATVAIP